LKTTCAQLRAEIKSLEARLERRDRDLDALRVRILRVAGGQIAICSKCLSEMRPAPLTTTAELEG